MTINYRKSDKPDICLQDIVDDHHFYQKKYLHIQTLKARAFEKAKRIRARKLIDEDIDLLLLYCSKRHGIRGDDKTIMCEVHEILKPTGNPVGQIKEALLDFARRQGIRPTEEMKIMKDQDDFIKRVSMDKLTREDVEFLYSHHDWKYDPFVNGKVTDPTLLRLKDKIIYPYNKIVVALERYETWINSDPFSDIEE